MAEECYASFCWWDGEAEGQCELGLEHDGPHTDGTFWFDDHGDEVDEPEMGGL